MIKRTGLLLLLLLLPAYLGAQVAPVPKTMSFQGRLTKPDGTPAANGDYSVRVSLWNASSGGSEQWNQTLNPVVVRNGVFSALLSGLNEELFNQPLYLEIKVGNDAPLTPRQPLTSVAYAMRADGVKDGGVTSSSILNGTITGEDIANGSISIAKLVGGGAPPTGLAGGDLTGTYPNPDLATKITSLVKVSGGALVAYPAPSALDQSQTFALGRGYFPQWQSFTPSVTGYLTRLEILGRSRSFAQNVTITLRAGEGTTGPIISSQSLNLSHQDGYQACNFATPVRLFAGNLYTWIISNYNNIEIGYSGDSTDHYPRGKSDSANGAIDYAFKTYMATEFGIGLNTNVPVSALHINSPTGITIGSDPTNGGFTTLQMFLSDASNGYAELQAVRASGSMWGNLILNQQGGNVGIGTNNPTYKLHVNGSVAGVGNYNNVSDARYKTNIHTVEDPLETILNLHGVTFDWKRQEFPGMNFTAGRQVGFIAQEVEKILPELVTTDSNGYKSVAYSNIVPVLVEAVKTLHTQIKTQYNQIELLQAASKENAMLKIQLVELAETVRQLKATQESRSNHNPLLP